MAKTTTNVGEVRAHMGRRERNALRTRNALLRAAREQMAEGGPESITILAVTERADIGQGTFYNYFKSRDDLIDEAILDTVERLGQRLDAMSSGIEDAAEVYSFSLRHLMRTALSDPVWGWFMVRVGIAQQGLLQALGPRAARDLQYGVDSGRFTIPDVRLAAAMTLASVLGAMQEYLEHRTVGDPTDHYAEYLLRMVGIPPVEAHEIVQRPVPPLPDPVEDED